MGNRFEQKGVFGTTLNHGAGLLWRFRRGKEKEPSGFRELPAVQFWSVGMTLPITDTMRFWPALHESAAVSGYKYQGFFTAESDALTYHFTRFPRHKDGIPSLEQCDAAMEVLAQQAENVGVNFTMQREYKQPLPGVRVVLGLIEGYNTNAKVHTSSEVKSSLGRTFDVTPAVIFVVGPEIKLAEYEEPATVVTGPKAMVPRVYALAERFGQHRFAVEDLQEGQAFMVETPLCTNPDPGPVK